MRRTDSRYQPGPNLPLPELGPPSWVSSAVDVCQAYTLPWMYRISLLLLLPSLLQDRIPCFAGRFPLAASYRSSCALHEHKEKVAMEGTHIPKKREDVKLLRAPSHSPWLWASCRATHSTASRVFGGRRSKSTYMEPSRGASPRA